VLSTQRGAGRHRAACQAQWLTYRFPAYRPPGNLDSCFASLCKTLLCSARRIVAADVCVKCQAAPLKWRECALQEVVGVCVVWLGCIPADHSLLHTCLEGDVALWPRAAVPHAAMPSMIASGTPLSAQCQ
jgi:hypothetical protein